jgi:predicted nucleotidyltransferase
MTASHPLTPDAVIAVLRAHAPELQQPGIRHVCLFGSLARGEAGPDSDIDLVAELDPDARVGLFRLIGLERRLLDRNVDLLPEPIEQPRLRANVDRDRRSAF